MFWKKETILMVLVLTLFLGAQIVKADFTFGTPTNLGPTINSSSDDVNSSLSADGLILVFCSFMRSGGLGHNDIWLTTRATVDDPWAEPVNLGPTINTSRVDVTPSISPDGCTLYYASNGKGGLGGFDIWVTTRESTDDDWGESVNLGSMVNGGHHESGPCISADELTLYFSSDRRQSPGPPDLYVVTRESKDDLWGDAEMLGPPVNSINSNEFETRAPSISADGLTLFFDSGFWGFPRPGGLGEVDIWVTRRKTQDADWGEPMNLGSPVNTSAYECTPTISADGSILYFAHDPYPELSGYGYYDLYQVSIEPVVDLNADGIVDSADMCIIVDNWHTENTLCDIAPPPLGDGFVDVQDLIVLAEHLFEEIPSAESIE
jgi:Tol biopolymer transport system component